MPFLSLSLYNFRNLKNDNINLNFKEVFFVGENGQGKSNLLEALYYSAYGSSFRTHSDSQIIKNLQQNFSLISMYSNEKESLQRIKIIYDKKKSIEKNGKKSRRYRNNHMSDYFDVIYAAKAGCMVGMVNYYIFDYSFAYYTP